MDALLFGTEHGISFLDVKGIEERLEVTYRHVDTVLCQGVGIQVGEAGLLLVRDVLGPDSAETQVEALGGVKPSMRPVLPEALTAFSMAV